MRRMQRAQRIAVRLEEGSLEVSGVLGDALSNCLSQMCPAHPPYGGIREDIFPRGCRTFLTVF